MQPVWMHTYYTKPAARTILGPISPDNAAEIGAHLAEQRVTRGEERELAMGWFVPDRRAIMCNTLHGIVAAEVGNYVVVGTNECYPLAAHELDERYDRTPTP